MPMLDQLTRMNADELRDFAAGLIQEIAQSRQDIAQVRQDYQVKQVKID